MHRRTRGNAGGGAVHRERARRVQQEMMNMIKNPHPVRISGGAVKACCWYMPSVCQSGGSWIDAISMLRRVLFFYRCLLVCV